MSFTLAPVTLSDRATLSNIIARANFDDPYSQLVWPNSTIESRTAGSYARLAKTLTGPCAYFIKLLDEDGSAIAYAQWTFPTAVWEKLIVRNPLKNVSQEERERFKRESEESCDSPGWPTGLRRDVVETLEPAMEEANAKVFPAGEERVELNQIKVLPSHQRRGAGSVLLRWGIEIADNECLKIGLEATPFGRGLYEKFGFETKLEVHHDLARFGMPEGYTHAMMLREPRAPR